jgi:hypothetical protein
VRVVKILEDEADRRVRRVGLEERLEHGATDEARLRRVVAHGAREGALLARNPQEMAEEVDDIADLAVSHHLRDLSAYLALGVLDRHPFDQTEARAEDLPEQAIRGRGVSPAPAIDARDEGRLERAVLDHEVLDQAALADPRRADQRHDAGLAPLLDGLQRLVEHRELGLASDEGRPGIADEPPRGLVLRHAGRTLVQLSAREEGR